LITGKFSGVAYAANIGWIALDTALSDLDTTTISRPDSDGDGIADPWEMLEFGSLSAADATSDQDGDGASDLAEYGAGTEPNDAESMLEITEFSLSPDLAQVTLTWTIEPTRSYRIEFDIDLSGGWNNSALGTFTPAAGTSATRTITPGSAECRFIRVVAVQPLP